MQRIAVFDIETIARPEMVDFVAQPEVVTMNDVPKSYRKNEDRVAAWIDSEVAKRRAKYDERLSRMPLDVDYARTVAIGSMRSVGRASSVSEVLLACDDTEERAMLQRFWREVEGYRLCGYNIRNFDIPILIRRSWVLGVKACPPMSNYGSRYNTAALVDLMLLLYNHGYGPGPRARGLKAVCKMYGIPNPLPDVDGSQVATMTDEERHAYVTNDVEMTWALAERTYGYYWM